MQKFKRIMLPMQGKNKRELHWLYNTSNDLELPKEFYSGKLKFYFGGTGFRSSERMILFIEIPENIILKKDLESTETVGEVSFEKHPSVETYLLHLIAPLIQSLSEEYRNEDKDTREKASFEVQQAGSYMVRRSGIHYDEESRAYILRMNFNVPLVNALSVNAKAAVRAVRDILGQVEAALKGYDREELGNYIKTYRNQQEIRKYMKENGLCAFIANGSILPRENGTSAPMQGAIPFRAPKEQEVAVPLSDGTTMIGMGIHKGITVITGGGYSGKSTLLDALERGIYNHVPGDGREYVLTDQSALKIYAEDGRPVSELNMSPFFKFLPGGDLTEFSTLHASGSVSQAANIIEAVCGGCRLFLIDEDKSATNFMIRDKNMRLVVKDEPIIPFTDRVRELQTEKGVSTILVIGGSSEYLSYADTVILMRDYLPHAITKEIQMLDLTKPVKEEGKAAWTHRRRVIPKETSQPFLFFRKVETENEKKIILDEYSADITLLTALTSGDQLNTLACVMKHLLSDKEADDAELLSKVETYAVRMLAEGEKNSLVPEAAQLFYEEIRPLDAFCCVNRMRGLHFKLSGGDVE